jgi:hypothetical protein
MRYAHNTHREPPSIAFARRLLKARTGPPREEDRPPPSTFPGRAPVVLPGQLDLDGREVIPNLQTRRRRARKEV